MIFGLEAAAEGVPSPSATESLFSLYLAQKKGASKKIAASHKKQRRVPAKAKDGESSLTRVGEFP